MKIKKAMTIFSISKISSKLFFCCISLMLLNSVLITPSANANELRGAYTQTAQQPSKLDISAVKAKLSYLNRSPELITKIDEIRNNLSADAPMMFCIELDLFKLDVLSKIGDFKAAAKLAENIYSKNPRTEYPSEKLYGDTMFQIVESLAKTDNLGISYDIILKLRMSVYQKPDIYLSFIVDKSLMEVYIETSDYQRALSQTLSILNNAEYMSNPDIEKWRPVAINEVAYLYNQLSDGKNALIYLEKAAQLLEIRDLTLTKLSKAKALNFANRGRAHLLIGNYDQAKNMGLKVVSANKDLKQGYLTAVSHRLIGSANYHEGRYHEALKHLRSGIALADKENNLTLRRALYRDYALSLESIGEYEMSIIWYKKLFTLETHLQEVITATRSKINDVEFSAFKDHQRLTHLEHELGRNKTTNKMMFTTIISLLGAATVLICLLLYMRMSQKKLILSEQKAQAANKAKSEFLANMSHEIRTPMNGVLGMAQVLERTPLTSQQKHYLDIVKQSGSTLLAIINDILDFSKIEADKFVLNCQVNNLDETLRDAIALLKPNARQKNLELKYSFNPELPKYYLMDSNRIRQILLNLIGNAIKFTSEGQIGIHVDGEFSQKQLRVTINVSDTGIGIEQDKLKMIFDKFTQVGDTTTRAYGGTGLGLAICHKLTSAMNGEISVTSKLGVGSTFTVNLPLKVMTPLSKPQKTSEMLHITRAA